MWTELRSRRIATGISVKATSPKDDENGYAIADLTMAAVDPGITVHLRDRALFVVTPADGQCCEGFTRVGEDSGPARERLIAADDNVNVARIELCAAAPFDAARLRSYFHVLAHRSDRLIVPELTRPQI
jgi:hypothetical protein